MSKRKLVYMVLTLVLVLSSTTTFAADQGDVEAVGGVTYNTFNGEMTVDGIKQEELRDELKSGMGFYAGGRYWLSDWLGIEAGYDQAGSSYSEYDEDFKSNVEYNLGVAGPYGKLNIEVVDEMLALNAGIVSYSLTGDVTANNVTATFFEGSGIGFLAGADLSIPVNDNLSLTAGANYRLADLGVDKVYGESVPDTVDAKLNMSGLRGNIGLTAKF